MCFSALQRAENSSIRLVRKAIGTQADVSVLFSEPKIPQFASGVLERVAHNVRFQCSSASRKFLNSISQTRQRLLRNNCFSALQRAENSSIRNITMRQLFPYMFQCSSASRKFLNFVGCGADRRNTQRFQCSSASRKFLNFVQHLRRNVFRQRFQCSSASRKFLNSDLRHNPRARVAVSVLFSEPKIPQFVLHNLGVFPTVACFSALQRAENSSMVHSGAVWWPRRLFQCSSASRKFLNCSTLCCSRS